MRQACKYAHTCKRFHTHTSPPHTGMDIWTLLRGALRVLLFAILAFYVLKAFHGDKYGFN